MQILDFFKRVKFSADETPPKTNQIESNSDDGANEIVTSHEQKLNVNSLTFDVGNASRTELINMYRQISKYSIVNYAIEDIVNETVSFNDEEEPIELDLSDIDTKILPDATKKKIYERYSRLARILNLKDSIHRRLREFYVDGSMSYQKVVDINNAKTGLLDVAKLDVKRLTKYRHIVRNDDHTIASEKEYFKYDVNGINGNLNSKSLGVFSSTETHLLLDPESVSYVTCGEYDQDTGNALGWLHNAVEPANKLRLMENSLVIYRITRAPERRIFYVDVSGMPPNKAEAYVKNLSKSYRNRMSFNAENGSFVDQRHLNTMQEDYWMPRNSQGKGTEVNTLPGGQNLDAIEDVRYFQKNLYKSLNVPVSRLESEATIMLGGRIGEINREELKLTKHVSKIRKRFNLFLLDILRTDLILTNIVTAEEWEEFCYDINLVYALDLYIEEQKKAELMRDRIELAGEWSDYVGKYVSNHFIRTNVLKQTDEEIIEEDKKIKEEANNPQFLDIDPEMMPRDQPNRITPTMDDEQDSTIQPEE